MTQFKMASVRKLPTRRGRFLRRSARSTSIDLFLKNGWPAALQSMRPVNRCRPRPLPAAGTATPFCSEPSVVRSGISCRAASGRKKRCWDYVPHSGSMPICGLLSCIRHCVQPVRYIRVSLKRASTSYLSVS